MLYLKYSHIMYAWEVYQYITTLNYKQYNHDTRKTIPMNGRKATE